MPDLSTFIWPVIIGIATILLAGTPWGKLLTLIKPGKKLDADAIKLILADLLKDLKPLSPVIPVTPNADAPDTFFEKLLARVQERLQLDFKPAAVPIDAELSHGSLHKLQDVIVDLYDHGDAETATALAALLPRVSAACCRPANALPLK